MSVSEGASPLWLRALLGTIQCTGTVTSVDTPSFFWWRHRVTSSLSKIEVLQVLCVVCSFWANEWGVGSKNTPLHMPPSGLSFQASEWGGEGEAHTTLYAFIMSVLWQRQHT